MKETHHRQSWSEVGERTAVSVVVVVVADPASSERRNFRRRQKGAWLSLGRSFLALEEEVEKSFIRK